MNTNQLVSALKRLPSALLGRFCSVIFNFPRRFFLWLKGVAGGLRALWLSLGPGWLRGIWLGAALLIAAWAAASWYVTPNLTTETVHRVRYLNGGWSEEQRQKYYFTPQGTELLGLPYEWLVNLELPLSREMFASEQNMRGWGFVIDPGQLPSARNPGNLPVGLSWHKDPISGEERLDISCSACHTGELHYNGVAMRVDGGQAVQSIATAKRGEFITTLGLAVLETRINPFKWQRFADRVAGQDSQARSHLGDAVWAFLGRLKAFSSGAGASRHYPTEEGRGRTDAVGRIANVVFGFDLNEPANYRTANAPVSYPFLWDIWRFDWVQYTGFTNQPMARNVGEGLGVLAPVRLVGEDGKLLGPGEFGESVVDIDGIHCIEGLLRDLEPPRWPADVLGEIDIPLAQQGLDLFQSQCAVCHGPHRSHPYRWPVASGPDQNPAQQVDVNWRWDMAGQVTEKDGQAWREDWRSSMWAVPWVGTDVIGTDSTAADNFLDTTYDASKVIPGSKPVSAGAGLQILLNRLVPTLYKNWEITGDKVAEFDGLNIPFRVQQRRAYKARPLHGVWATPPFLHNGSVPTLYDLLSPLQARPKTFAVGNREYDPVKLGYVTSTTSGSFVHDTARVGNSNRGHLFTDADMPGRIGGLLSEQQRMALLEYLKVLGNPDYSEPLGGDPMNWARYPAAPAEKHLNQSCDASHLQPLSATP